MTDKRLIPEKADHILERDIGDEVVVMCPEGHLLHTFEGTARFLWSRIDGRRTIGQLLAELTEEYQIDVDVAERDLERFLTELQDLELASMK